MFNLSPLLYLVLVFYIGDSKIWLPVPVPEISQTQTTAPQYLKEIHEEIGLNLP